MAKPKTLKVYRTPIGFHDAYVAAPSQKAALEAWGSSHNLFARGVAEIVIDEALTAEPLANPGQVIKRSRGTTAEQIAALPDSEAKPKPPPQTDDKAEALRPAKRAPKPKPRPSRDAIEAAEGELAKVEDRYADADRALATEQAALDRRREDLEKAHQAEVSKARKALDRVEERYSVAIRKWRG